MSKKKNRVDSLLLDTNIFILLCVGSVDKSKIIEHKRLKGYDQNDFDLLLKILAGFRQTIVSPYVLAEISNLIFQDLKHYKEKFAIALREITIGSSESVCDLRKIVNDCAFVDFGIVDAAILGILDTNRNVQLVTADFHLHQVAVHRGLNSWNFSHLRDTRPDFGST